MLRRLTPAAIKQSLRRLQADAFGLGMEHQVDDRLDSLDRALLRDLGKLADGIALFLRVAARVARYALLKALAWEDRSLAQGNGRGRLGAPLRR
jgi:hypothetical protein